MTAYSMSDQSNASTRVMDDDMPEQPRPRPTSHISLLFDHSRIDDAVLNYAYPGKGTHEHPYVVSWIPEDAGNPYNWSKGAKWTITMISALTCFAVAFSSSAYTGEFPSLTTASRRLRSQLLSNTIGEKKAP